jgi:hypothetical protein
VNQARLEEIKSRLQVVRPEIEEVFRRAGDELREQETAGTSAELQIGVGGMVRALVDGIETIAKAVEDLIEELTRGEGE